MTTPGLAVTIVTVNAGISDIVVDRSRDTLTVTIHHDIGDTRVAVDLPDITAELQVLHEPVPVLAARRKPARLGLADDAESKTVGMDLLTHALSSLTPGPGGTPPRLALSRCHGLIVADNDQNMTGPLADDLSTASCSRQQTAHSSRVAGLGFLYHQVLRVKVVIVLGVGHRRLHGAQQLEGRRAPVQF